MIRMPNIGGRYGPRNRKSTMLRAVTETIRVLNDIDDSGSYFLEKANLIHYEDGERIMLTGKHVGWYNHFIEVTESVRTYATFAYISKDEPESIAFDCLPGADCEKLLEFHVFLGRCSW